MIAAKVTIGTRTYACKFYSVEMAKRWAMAASAKSGKKVTVILK